MNYLRLAKYAASLAVVSAIVGMLYAGWRYVYVAPRQELAAALDALDESRSQLSQARADAAAAATACGQFQAQAAQCSAQLDDLAGQCATQSNSAAAAALEELEALRRRHDRILRSPDIGPDRMNRAFEELST